MSFFARSGVAIASGAIADEAIAGEAMAAGTMAAGATTRPRLDFAALVASLAPARSDAASADDAAARLCAPPDALSLVTVLLGRPDWRMAALTLGGCFVMGGA